MPTYLTTNPSETVRIAAQLARLLKRSGGPAVLALSGELGSGKTTFIQGIARALGVRGAVQSPTFILMKIYQLGLHARPFHRFIHVDAYRLHSIREAGRLALREHLADPEAIVAIEWAERVRRLIPRRAIWITFRHDGQNTRRIEILNKDPIRNTLERSNAKSKPRSY